MLAPGFRIIITCTVFKANESILQVLDQYTSQWGCPLRSFPPLIPDIAEVQCCLKTTPVPLQRLDCLKFKMAQQWSHGLSDPAHLRCDNSFIEEILSQVSTSQSSNVAVSNCFLSITEYRNFTLPFTQITILPLEISSLNYSITEMSDNLPPAPFGEGQRNNSKSLYCCCNIPWHELGN